MITTDMISQVGFPIAVVAYLLYERQRTTTKLIEAINSLKTAIIIMEKRFISK